uniref:Uncharacterized protein n=1 Tax=Globodera rostochiensis TaxID=31243 RepID=A0A914GP18_GLORO
MKLKILQLICLINYVYTFPNDLFDELWETNQSEAQANSIESRPKIKIEPREEQFNERWRDESSLKGIVKVEHEPHYGAVKVEKQLEDHVKEEDQHGQATNTSDYKKIGDNSNKHLSDQNNSTDHDEIVDEQQNESNEYAVIADMLKISTGSLNCS